MRRDGTRNPVVGRKDDSTPDATLMTEAFSGASHHCRVQTRSHDQGGQATTLLRQRWVGCHNWAAVSILKMKGELMNLYRIEVVRIYWGGLKLDPPEVVVDIVCNGEPRIVHLSNSDEDGQYAMLIAARAAAEALEIATEELELRE